MGEIQIMLIKMVTDFYSSLSNHFNVFLSLFCLLVSNSLCCRGEKKSFPSTLLDSVAGAQE